MQDFIQWLKAAPSSPTQLCIQAVNWIALLKPQNNYFRSTLLGIALHLLPPLQGAETNTKNPTRSDLAALRSSRNLTLWGQFETQVKKVWVKEREEVWKETVSPG